MFSFLRFFIVFGESRVAALVQQSIATSLEYYTSRLSASPSSTGGLHFGVSTIPAFHCPNINFRRTYGALTIIVLSSIRSQAPLLLNGLYYLIYQISLQRHLRHFSTVPPHGSGIAHEPPAHATQNVHGSPTVYRLFSV
ncbi:hypothetical protein HD554DRAFT_1204982 [Boletus coccyginus]|nr:hypothetical protein HD554DRAFT_1204982 [Boletus coccyginus]